jgi:coenzyme F420-reducing hydrogenase beta subunit
MRFNRFGEYNPFKEKECVKECGLCLKVCPFADGNDNEDKLGNALYGVIPGFFHHKETGYYLECFAGYAPDMRSLGSSGGMATWLLSTLLKRGIVDYVISVIPNNDPDKLFKFTIFNDAQSVLGASGSAYYPVELSGVLKEIKNNPGRYAIIGLPCFIKAIRLAARKNKHLKERITVTLGLVCGQQKSKLYTEYLAALSGITPSLANVHYRGKSPEKPASNFYFSCTNNEGNTGKIFWNEGVGEAWSNRWFTQNACNYCDDVFAECADVTFMDAWLPEYSKDFRGTSLVLVRSPQLQTMIVEGARSKEIILETIPVLKAVDSQAGSIAEKHSDLGYRLFTSNKAGFVTPQKRIEPSGSAGIFQKKKVILKEQMRVLSRNFWAEQSDKGSPDLKNFRGIMNPYLNQMTKWKKFTATSKLPLRFIHHVRRKVRGCFHG